MNTSNIYFAKKSLRKILRITNKHIKYTGDKEVEVQLLLHYCTSFKGLKIATQKSAALNNLYNNQIKKIGTAISSMHDDLQHEYLRELDRLQ
jgi:transcriptional regulatory protein LevR